MMPFLVRNPERPATGAPRAPQARPFRPAPLALLPASHRLRRGGERVDAAQDLLAALVGAP